MKTPNYFKIIILALYSIIVILLIVFILAVLFPYYNVSNPISLGFAVLFCVSCIIGRADSSHKCNFWLNNNLFITNIGFS